MEGYSCLVSVGQLGQVKFTLFSSLHRSRLSTPMSQSGEGIRAVMSRKEWFTANIIELGEDPEITS